MPILYKYMLCAVCAVLFSASLVFGGWEARSWYEGNQENNLNKIKSEIDKNQQDLIGTIGDRFEAQRTELEATNNHINLKLSTIINKPIYTVECVDQDAVDLLQQYKDKSKAQRGIK